VPSFNGRRFPRGNLRHLALRLPSRYATEPRYSEPHTVAPASSPQLSTHPAMAATVAPSTAIPPGGGNGLHPLQTAPDMHHAPIAQQPQDDSSERAGRLETISRKLTLNDFKKVRTLGTGKSGHLDRAELAVEPGLPTQGRSRILSASIANDRFLLQALLPVLSWCGRPMARKLIAVKSTL
jgi:hypothetical protein